MILSYLCSPEDKNTSIYGWRLVEAKLSAVNDTKSLLFAFKDAVRFGENKVNVQGP